MEPQTVHYGHLLVYLNIFIQVAILSLYNPLTYFLSNISNEQITNLLIPFSSDRQLS